jgi:hypothetical protein
LYLSRTVLVYERGSDLEPDQELSEKPDTDREVFYSSDPDQGDVIPEETQRCLGDEEAEKFLVSAGSLDFGHFEKVLKERAKRFPCPCCYNISGRKEKQNSTIFTG